MKIKRFNDMGRTLVLFISLGLLNVVSASELTGSTGNITGNPPVIHNQQNEAGKIDFHRTSLVDDNDELDISDGLEMSWSVTDSEGDSDTTLPTVEWICTDSANAKHVLASGVMKYDIHPEDKGCTIGVNITPTTVTGLPRENEPVTISDISTYNNDDNIPDGPVNPHLVNVVSYTVAPENPNAAYTVSADKKLQTAFAGAQLKLVTDNVDNQLTWTTSDASIADVNDDGIITIHKKGAFRITARHNEQRASYIFNPQKFYVFSEKTKMTWHDAESWCENQGYRMPSLAELSTQEGHREIPSNALWQEWGSSLNDVTHAGVVYWSTDGAIAEMDAYFYMYTATGHTTSNISSVPEGVACITP